MRGVIVPPSKLIVTIVFSLQGGGFLLGGVSYEGGRSNQTSFFFYEGGNRASVQIDSKQYPPPRGGFLLRGGEIIYILARVCENRPWRERGGCGRSRPAWVSPSPRAIAMAREDVADCCFQRTQQYTQKRVRAHNATPHVCPATFLILLTWQTCVQMISRAHHPFFNVGISDQRACKYTVLFIPKLN